MQYLLVKNLSYVVKFVKNIIKTLYVLVLLILILLRNNL